MTHHGTSGHSTSDDQVRPGDVFSAVIGHESEQWRVVAVLGIRVLAERVTGGHRRSFTLHFVRHQLSPAAQVTSG
ncbi:hypothetical protein [Rathayibacter rathayi]|uniref:Uncharacterized protein n=1 Tax=Rathayibacter rathayi TaxID=33887 RepID=A0ABD6W4U9_RATRA|nr:hypothetical protein [Rathayibacter rathayi]PPF09803.1 hypothetical protein C5C04_14320 [Rathayibacter rathayi]PPF21382.1 hypothetical protein C5C34_13120 [Rathayibacter rathayi]PPG93013.1 hypothetical protein C5C22_12245 [Rathayibacter rathayi]